ncbi:MAG: CHAD domain-containing protein [Halochromatium sp.]|uniref:CHAD domain-containing protein n=1 Tax=Halochromatium sp. TaxID=2049430 RepID=UPI003979EBC8
MGKTTQEPADVLDPAQRADLATKRILRRLLATIEANVEGARQNRDSEFLHDLRVATRRTRSALSQIKGVFPESRGADFKARFAWLQQVTGPVRDLDVYLLDFPNMRQQLPAALQPDLEPLYQLLLAQHAEAQQQLAMELGSPRFKQLLEDWRAFLDAPIAASAAAGTRTDAGADAGADADAGASVEPSATPPVGLGAVDADSSVANAKQAAREIAGVANAKQDSSAAASAEATPTAATLPIKQVADRRIRKLLKRVRAEGRAINEDSPPEDLHELRKSCKKLRYLMEFFQSLYEKERIREQIKQTKRLLDNLGRFQDTAVQARHLRETAECEGGEGRLPPATLLAMGALIGQLLEDQARARDGFSEVFAGFDSAENAARFAALFDARDIAQCRPRRQQARKR